MNVLIAPTPAALRRHPGWWGVWLLSKLPFWVLYTLGDGIGFLLHRVVRYRLKVVRENLAKSFPEKLPAELRQLENGFYRNLTDVLVETLKLASISRPELAARVRFVDMERATQFLDRGQAVLGLSSHLTNWEWLLPATRASMPQYRLDGVYRPLKSKFGELLFTHLRTRFGSRLVRMQDVGRNMIRERGTVRALCLVADQTPPGGEVQYYTRFLNQDTPFFVGTDKLAGAGRLPVCFFSIRRRRRGYYEVSAQLLHDGAMPLPPVPKHVSDNPADYPLTEAYARALEANIAAEPADYLWSHRRWKNARPGK